MLNLTTTMIFSENSSVLTDFYKKLLEKDPEWSGGDFVGFKAGSGMLVIGPHNKVKGKSMNPERVMFNFETEDVQKEFERVKSLGSTVIAEPYHPSEDMEALIATFADPDGNYFQIVSPFKKNV